jgi:hypothetical protein
LEHLDAFDNTELDAGDEIVGTTTKDTLESTPPKEDTASEEIDSRGSNGKGHKSVSMCSTKPKAQICEKKPTR